MYCLTYEEIMALHPGTASININNQGLAIEFSVKRKAKLKQNWKCDTRYFTADIFMCFT